MNEDVPLRVLAMYIPSLSYLEILHLDFSTDIGYCEHFRVANSLTFFIFCSMTRSILRARTLCHVYMFP